MERLTDREIEKKLDHQTNRKKGWLSRRTESIRFMEKQKNRMILG